MSVLTVLINLFFGWMTISLFFQLIVSLFGFRKKTEDYASFDPKMRFLVLIPAHNEEGVIEGIIRNMEKMEYPRHLFDYYVLADNCTDNTAEVAKNAGAKVLQFQKNHPNEATGKSVVLKKAFEALKGYQNDYDAVFFFDADNLVDVTMFAEVNSQFLDADDRAEIIQCYLGCKNKRGLVAYFYYITYTISNRYLQYSRQRLGLNCGIGGTGFAVRTRYLYERGGWTVESLTEDTELQIAATLDQRRVLWNNHVRVYDEKPTQWGMSLRQRIRWAQGHWFVAFRNTAPIFKSLIKGRTTVWETISMIVQLYFPASYVVATINTVLIMIHNAVLSTAPFDEVIIDQLAISIMPNGIGVFLVLYTLLLQFHWGDYVDNGQKFSILSVPYVLLSFVLNTIVAGVAQFIGLFKYRQQSNWDKTEHTVNEIDETLKKQETPSL